MKSSPALFRRLAASWSAATRLAALLPALLASAVLAPAAALAANVIHTEPSAFSPVVVYENDNQRCMTFGSVQALGRQSCIDLAAPQRMVFTYTPMMMSALFVQPAPRNILIVGLGGGTLPKALAEVLPEANIDTVEIDPAVVNVAKQYFGFRTGPRQHIITADGRAYIEAALREGKRYDIVMLDAFDIDYIPKHLMTREFVQTARQLLPPGGVLAANTFTSSDRYDSESVTYADVFGTFFNLRANNRVILAVNGPLPDDAQLNANAQAWAPKLGVYGIDVAAQLARFSRQSDWSTTAQVLKD
ncbi:fused MFS/spermidine synthase [Alcaligenaceae bacterium B3P038]|nr:fused MFS/spermidine synthase [Alcaligenaceae bacterium B3P038]